MKKLLGLLMIVTLVIPASADVLKNVDLMGEIETIASDVNHHTKVDGKDYYNQNVNTRVLAGLSAELVEDVKANVLFQYVTPWDGNMEGDSISGYENKVYVSNANVVLSNLFDCFEATVGRQFYGDEDSAVMYLGPNHYNAEEFGYAPSLDAAKLTYADDVKAFTVIAGKVTPKLNNLNQNKNGTTVWGADFRMNVTDMVKVQAYGYNFRNIDALNNSLPEEADADAGLYGAKLSVNPEDVLFSVEYARNFGGKRLIKEHKDTGYMVKADAGVNVEALGVRGTFLYAKDSFFAWGNYTPGLLVGHKLYGDIFSYSDDGVRLFNLGFDYNLTESWALALDGYAFQGRTGKHAATLEADLTAKYTHNEYVQLFAGIGYAKYGNDYSEDLDGTYKATIGSDNVKGQLGMLINF